MMAKDKNIGGALDLQVLIYIFSESSLICGHLLGENVKSDNEAVTLPLQCVHHRPLLSLVVLR